MTIKLGKIGTVIMVLIVATLVYGVVRYNSKTTELGTFIEQYDALKIQADAAMKFSDSIRIENKRLADSVANAESQVITLKAKSSRIEGERNSLKNDVRELERLLGTTDTDERPLLGPDGDIKDQIILTQKVIIAKGDSTIAVKDSIISIRDVSISQMGRQITNLTFANDSLEDVIINLPKPPRDPTKWLGFLPKPSRLVTFIAGAVTTAIILR